MLANDPTTGLEAKPPWAVGRMEGLGAAAVALVAAGLRFYRLDRNGTGNPYYGASVRSMLASASNFFFGAFDPVGIVTVDKPPVALWIQAANARLFGYSGLSVLAPQAVMGVASVVLTWLLVRRAFGTAAGLVAGLALAVMPICVAMDRDNLPDTALVLTLLLATWALTRAAGSGRLAPLIGAMALVGLGFNIKMLAAFVVLPTFTLAYWLAAPVAWKTRLARLAISGAVLVSTSLSWPVIVQLTPKERRPYIGGSMTNSALELALGYNGVVRIIGMGAFGPPGGGPPTAGGPALGLPGASPGGPMGIPGFGGAPGLGRFAGQGMAGLITWLFPVAVLGSMVAAARARPSRPIGREHLGLVLWGGWFATHWLVFSFAQGMFHEYYSTVMGPAVAALAGIGAVALWRESERGGWRTLLLPAVAMLTAVWQGWIVGHYPDWKLWLIPMLFGGVGLGSLGVVASMWSAARRPSGPWAGLSAGLIAAGLLTCPTAWSTTVVLAKGSSMLPTADPTLLGARSDWPAPVSPFLPGPGGLGNPMEPDPEETKRLVAFLEANRRGESILVAGLASIQIAPIIIETGGTAVSIGGFMGMDRALSKDRFVELVESGRLRFFLLAPGPGGFGPPGPGGPGGADGSTQRRTGGSGPPGMMGNGEIIAWVLDHGKPVETSLWKADEPNGGLEPGSDPEAGFDPMSGGGPPNPAKMFGMMRRMTRLYDLRPKSGLVAAAPRAR